MPTTRRSLPPTGRFLLAFGGALAVAAAAAVAQAPAGDAASATGARLFARHCAACHGEAGDGAGRFAYLMNPRPRNLLAGKFKLASTQNMVPTDEDLRTTITRGMPGSAMPPWGHLPPEQIDALVAYVRELHTSAVRAELDEGVVKGTFSREEAAELLEARTRPGPALVIPEEPSFADLAWFNGRRVYTEACAACHGADGEPVAAAVKFDDEGFPDPPRSFVSGIFKGGSDGKSVYHRVLKGMPGTPMPAYEGVYKPEEVWDLVHYVQSLARPGAQERAQLEQATILAAAAAALPAGPTDPAWNEVPAVYVGLTPLWWTAERVEGLLVQAVHAGGELAMRLTWLDPTIDERAVRTEEFRDAVAVQFTNEADPPFFMGEASDHGAVTMWMWKADRAKNLADGYQDVDAAFPDRAVDMYPECPIRAKDMSNVDWPHGAITEHAAAYITAWGAGNLVADPKLATSVEALVARGPGTTWGRPGPAQQVRGEAARVRGAWSVQLAHALGKAGSTADAAAPVPGPDGRLHVAFAVWDGSAGDRDGKKNFSVWQKLVLEAGETNRERAHGR